MASAVYVQHTMPDKVLAITAYLRRTLFRAGGLQTRPVKIWLLMSESGKSDFWRLESVWKTRLAEQAAFL